MMMMMMMMMRTLVLDPPPAGFELVGREYRPIERSRLIDLGASDLIEQIDWSPGE